MVDASLSVNLAVAVAAALVGGALARLLGQSALVGYIAAGIVISPFTPGPISDVTTIERLADIGVIFLMFGIGIQFSLRDLVRSSAITLGAAAQIVLSIVVGAGATLALGWTWHEALYAGAAAGMTSSTVVGKLLAETGEEDSQHGRIAIIWSLVQDLSTVVLVVLLGGLSGNGGLSSTLPAAVLKAAGFIGVMVLVGTRVLPWVLAQIARFGSRELFILAVGALSLGAAVLSARFGLSLALGAFIAGTILGESLPSGARGGVAGAGHLRRAVLRLGRDAGRAPPDRPASRCLPGADRRRARQGADRGGTAPAPALPGADGGVRRHGADPVG
jgi:CPA2 family monovalent cation:H+ antiporter-2